VVVPKVLLGRESEVKLVVVDLDTTQIAKTCMRPQFQASGARRWLLNLPGAGAVYAELSVSGLTPQGTAPAPDLKGFTLDPQVPCDESVVKVDAADLRYAVVSGLRDSMSLTADASGELVVLSPGSARIGLHVPPDMVWKQGTRNWGFALLVSNSKVLAVLAGSGSPRQDSYTERLLACRKGSSTLNRVPEVGEFVGVVRGFGQYLAIIESQRKTDKVKDSAGREEWRTEEAATGPGTAQRLENPVSVFPGRMHVYDVETTKTYTIETKQADSEVLLVENGTVYYRVNDRLYSVAITGVGLGTPRLLATSDVLRDTHWAFLTR
jgi:hypothetical protein